MNRDELLAIFTKEQRIEVDYPGIQREVDGKVIRHINLEDEDGFISYSWLDGDEVEAVIEAQITRFAEIPQDFEWKAYDYDTPTDLVERLRRRGFEIGEAEALLVLDLNEAQAKFDRQVPTSVRRILDPDEIDKVVAVEEVVWKSDQHALGERLKRDLQQHPEALNVYLAYEGEQPVAAAWIYFHTGSHFASLWGGSTLAAFRRQGHYTNLLAVRSQEALRRGFPLLTVDASLDSRPILEKHGFQYLTTSRPCSWKFARSTGGA